MFRCPVCGKATISVLDKFTMLPSNFFNRGMTNCSNCRNDITVPIWSGIFYVILALVILFPTFHIISLFTDNDTAYFVAVAIGIVLILGITLVVVPLIKFDDT